MLEELPPTIRVANVTCFLQAAVAPCGCWVVGYYSPHYNMLPWNYFVHKERLAEAVAELLGTLDLAHRFTLT